MSNKVIVDVHASAKLRNAIDSEPLECSDFGQTRFEYIHPDHLEGYACDYNIDAIVTMDEKLYRDVKKSKPREEAKRKFKEQVAKSAKRMFIICVLGEVSMECLRLMLDTTLHLTDHYLYLDDQESMPSTFLTAKHFPGAYESFVEVQYRLPFYLREGVFTKRLNDASKIPISYNDDAANETGHGTAATVFKATIDSGHRNFQTGQNNNFVIKVSKPPTGGATGIHDQAKNERSFLQALTTNNIQHPHILKSYTGFEYKETFYMVSERGNGHLLEFLNKAECSTRARAGVDYDWILQQFQGLAGALAEIHGSTKHGYHGFHHDIKPQNILVFSPSDTSMTGSTLKLCDWGLAKIGTGELTAAPAGNPGYWPPERSNTTQKHDVWSLGCVFLEVLVSFHEGKGERAKLITDATNRGSENGWYEHDRQEVSGAVRKKYTDIWNKGSEWAGLITIIEKMLNIGVKNRRSAAEVLQDLGG